MVTVNSVKEFKSAIIAGRTPIAPGNKRMKVVFIVAKVGQGLIDKTKRLPTKGELASAVVRSTAASGALGALSDGTIIVLAIIGTVGAIGILATCLKMRIRLVFNSDGTISLETYQA